MLVAQELSQGPVGLILRQSESGRQVLDNRPLELRGNERWDHAPFSIRAMKARYA